MISPKIKSLLVQTVKYYTSALCWFRQACYHRINVILLTVILTCVGFTALLWGAKLLSVARRYRYGHIRHEKTDLPSVTVCIPARNEIHALAECLERVLASDYPKLEVIVLDDNSSDDTPLIIRSFAHAGVRFIEGTPPPDDWVGKNFAMQTLLDEASGKYVVNMCADTKLQPDSISQMIKTILANDAAMLSVIPIRYDTNHFGTFVGSLRYFWELLFATWSSPPASSSVWIIERQRFIDDMGGFSDVRHSMRPEVLIAAHIAKSATYDAIVGAVAIGVGYEKRWSSQTATSRRIMYELIGGTWARAIGAFVWLALLNLPTFMLLSLVMLPWQLLHTVALASFVALVAMYAIYLRLTWASRWWVGMLLWPYVIFQELILFMQSVVGYVTHTITWKGRVIERVGSK